MLERGSVPALPRYRSVAWSLLLAAVALCAGCSWFTKSDGLTGIDPVPLTPGLRLLPTVTTAAVPYQNACGEQAAISVATPLKDIVPKKLGRVFKGISLDPGPGQPIGPEGLVEVGLGLKQIDLAIYRQTQKSYPVTVILGLELTFLADDGTVLFSKKMQSAGRGEVTIVEQSCDVNGLEAVVQEAVNLVSEGVARQIGESVRVREYAAQRKTGAPMRAMPASPAGALSAEEAAPTSPTQETVPAPLLEVAPPVANAQPLMPDGGAQTAALIFRAIIRDENRDQILQPDESLTIEVEVKNEGMVEAKDVEVTMSGTPALTSPFPTVLSIGNLQPGEVKRTTSTQRVPAVKEPLQGDLLLTLRSATPIHAVPLAKRFSLLIKPDKAMVVEPVTDVDQPPKSVAALKQPKALVVSIGVGRFRDEQVASVQYAGRDAEAMAKYLHAIAGIPDDRVRLLVDAGALKQDLAETFDEWLPKRADAATVVYVFFAGRALVDGSTGAVSLVPFDGTTSGMTRLYSVRRLQEALSRASIHRAILMFDVSLEPAPGADPATSALPNWDAGGAERGEQVMWMVGHKGLQEAHAYEQAKHGLFTYYLLRGLQGVADVDRDGTVAAGELCLYARKQVSRVAKEQYGNEQEPLCLPPPGQGAMVRIHPMAKGNNPKPAATPKKDPTTEPTPQSPRPTDVGPGQ